MTLLNQYLEKIASQDHEKDDWKYGFRRGAVAGTKALGTLGILRGAYEGIKQGKDWKEKALKGLGRASGLGASGALTGAAFGGPIGVAYQKLSTHDDGMRRRQRK